MIRNNPDDIKSSRHGIEGKKHSFIPEMCRMKAKNKHTASANNMAVLVSKPVLKKTE